MILDSGAFTAWSVGKTVKRDEYLAWALAFTQRNQHRLSCIRYINLDVIPGRFGTSASPEQVKQAYEASLLNASYLRACGLKVIEVFHQDEPFELLVKLVDRSDGELIALSPRNDVSTKQREEWLKKVTIFCAKTFGKDNMPPAHGLAVTTRKLVYAFPFYSVDSASWTACLRFGKSRASKLPKLPGYGDLQARVAYGYALRKELQYYQEMQSDATKFWLRRGVDWQHLN